jgi:hypothetical protein
MEIARSLAIDPNTISNHQLPNCYVRLQNMRLSTTRQLRTAPFKQSMGNYVEMDLVKGRTLERRQAAVIAVYIMHLRIMNNFGNPVILRL